MIDPTDPELQEFHSAPPPDPAPRPPSGGPLNLTAALADALAAVEALAEDPARGATDGASGDGGPGDAATAATRAAPPDAPLRTIDPSTIRGMPVRGSTDILPAAGQVALPCGPDRPLTELTQAHADLAVTRKRYQRVSDEADELRRRLQRAEMDMPQQATRTVLHTILPTLDHLDTMLAHFDAHENLSVQGREAVSMLRSEWQRTFSALQIEPFDAMGQPFDPVVHEVIALVADPKQPAGHVVRQVGRGYLHGGRLLRSAKVVVAAAPTPPDESPTE